MSSKKKNLITLVSLSLVLGICIVLYVFFPSSNNTDSGTKDQEKINEVTVDAIPENQILSISFSKEGETIWSVNKNQDKWNFSEDKTIPVNKEKMTAIMEELNPITATKKMEDVSELQSEYGLDKPQMKLTITAKDGREYQYNIGIKVPKEGMGYYSKTNADDAVYCLKASLVSAIDVTKNSMIQMDELPQIEADYMTYICVDNKKGNDFEAKRVSNKEKVNFYSNWNITKPYEKPLATSALQWSTTLGYFNSLSYKELVEYNSSNLDTYGLANPSSVITIKYYEAKKGYVPSVTATPSTVVTGNSASKDSYIIPKEKRDYKTVTLSIGKKEKDSYYVCEKGRNHVYKMEKDVVENMTNLDAYTSMDHCVYAVLATSIDGYDVMYEDTTLKVTRTPLHENGKKKENSKDEGMAVENVTSKDQKNLWKLNGKKISEEDEEAFLSPYSTAYLLEYSEKAVDSEMTEKSKKPVLTIVYHEEKRDVTVKYLPYDGTNFYRVDKNGMDYFLVDKLLVDDIIESFKQIEKLGK